MPFSKEISAQFKASSEVKLQALESLQGAISKAIALGIDCVKRGGTIYWIGNGGSAADAQHMAAELVGRYKRERKPIRSKAFTANSSNLTAIGNDYGYDFVFERQLEAFAKPEDLLIAISTSGNSKNIIKAVELARRVGTRVVSLTGATGGKLAPISDVLLNVPSSDTARIQETHLLIEHIFCDCIEQSVMG